MSKTLFAIGSFEQAYVAQEKYISYYHIHLEAERNQRITDMRIAFDTERKEHENQMLSEQNRFTKLQLERQTQVLDFSFGS